MEFAEAAARNEEVFRGVNERIDEGAEKHRVEGPLPFHCECVDASCVEKLPISASEWHTWRSTHTTRSAGSGPNRSEERRVGKECS